MTVSGPGSRPQIRPQTTSAPSTTQAAQRTQAPAAPAQAASSSAVAAPRQDGFRATISNMFNTARSAVTQGQQAYQRLSQNPIAQQALGHLNPSGLINQAQTWAQNQVNQRLSGWDGHIAGGSASGSRGTLNAGQIGQGLDAARAGQGPPAGLIPTTERASGERQVSQGTQDRLNAAGQRYNQIAHGAQQLANLAERAGIHLPSYDRTATVSDQRTLASSADGRHTVTAGGQATGSVHAGADGLRAEGNASYGVTASSRGDVSTTGRYGTASAGYNATATAGASASGRATLDANGLNVQAGAQVGVSASVDAQARVESNTLMTIGGQPIRANAQVNGHAEVGASASASGSAQVSPGPPPTFTAEGRAGAFAGARASVDGTIGVGPFSVTGHAEGQAGAGAEASAHAGYDHGRLHFGVHAGAALGLGGNLGFDVNVNVDQLRGMAQHAIGDVANAARQAISDPVGTLNRAEHAVQGAATTVEHAATQAASTVRNAATTVANAASSAASTVSNAASHAASRVGSFIRSLW
jgi:hypothetical protein